MGERNKFKFASFPRLTCVSSDEEHSGYESGREKAEITMLLIKGNAFSLYG